MQDCSDTASPATTTVTRSGRRQQRHTTFGFSGLWHSLSPHSSTSDGVSVSSAGDLDSDGIDDLIVGADRANIQKGRTYILFGNEQGFPARFELSGLLADGGGDGSAGFALNGIENNDFSGISVSAAGDLNADGIADVVVGALLADPDGRDRAGQSYVVFGRGIDTDGDGVADNSDNCLLLPNPDQRDTNGDGFGNVCDPDLNDDAIVNFLDFSLFADVVFGANPDADFDGDGTVNFVDLRIMRQFFFLPPGPSGAN